MGAPLASWFLCRAASLSAGLNFQEQGFTLARLELVLEITLRTTINIY